MLPIDDSVNNPHTLCYPGHTVRLTDSILLANSFKIFWRSLLL